MVDLRKYAMFPESNNFLDSSTPGLEELERFNKIMEETQKNLNIKSGSRNDIIYEKEADKKNKWITSKGEELSLEEMNSSHILNAIRKIKSLTGWREDWLPILEAELTRRSMIARTDDYEKKIITDEEKMYFLCTSCEYQMLSVEGGSLSDILNITINDQVKSYIRDNIFCIPLEQSKENFISEMDKLIRKTRSNSKEDAEKFMSYYEKYLLINVFSKEWSNFMNLMLGRHGK